VVCVHGLTRNSRDFDELAAYLAVRGCRVVCMDVVGRGDSDWLEHKADYGFAQYVADSAALLARITGPKASLLRRLQGAGGAHTIDWVGTSMGGLIGMMVAAEPGSPIRHLVLNDVGPLIPWPALARLKLASTGQSTRFASIDEVEAYLRDACVSFGPLKSEQWRRLARHAAGAQRTAPISSPRPGDRQHHALGRRRRRDVRRGFLLRDRPVEDLGRGDVSTLVLRGAESDLLLESTVEQMRGRGPAVKTWNFPG